MFCWCVSTITTSTNSCKPVKELDFKKELISSSALLLLGICGYTCVLYRLTEEKIGYSII